MPTKKKTTRKPRSKVARMPSSTAPLVSNLDTPVSPKGSSVSSDDLRLMADQREEDDARVRQAIEKKKSSKMDGDEERDFLSLAMERFQLAAEAEREWRTKSLDDLNFSVGKQWEDMVKNRRELDGRPCLTINRLPQFIRMITNEQRQQRPAVQVNPVGDGATKETAKVLQGIVRHIEVNSDAEVAYDTGAESQVVIGIGFWRVIREYLPGNTFNQELKIKRIKNPFTVYFDPNCMEHDYSDANWAFIIEDVPRKVFEKRYKNTHIASLENFASIGDKAPNWADRDTIRIAEYFYVEETPRRLAWLSDGSIVEEKEVPEGEEPLKWRDAPVREVKWSLITALDVLEQSDWDGRWIPIVPVLGDDTDVNGKRHISGIVRHAKDAQRMYNYWVSSATETIALAPKAPFIGAKGQFASSGQQWREANIRNFAFLEYDAIDVNGQAVGPPQRNVVEPPIQAIGGMVRQADNDLKSTTGIYDASLGQKGPDESGKAILARQRQSDVSTLNFSDNTARSVRHTGRILLDLIPKTYDTPRIQRIINPDQTSEHVGVYNSTLTNYTQDSVQAEFTDLKPAIQQIHDLGVGLYDVTVSVGPSYQTKRQEAVNAMMTLVASYPALMQAAGDLLISNMDWPGAQAIADRLKKLLPPPLQDNNSTDPQIRLQALQSQMQVLMQQHGALAAELNKATDIIKTKKLDLESKERIAAMQAQVQILVAESKVQGEAALSVLNSQLTSIQNRLDLLHENVPLDMEDMGAPAPALSSVPQLGTGAPPSPQQAMSPALPPAAPPGMR